jgi:hypothetical protein
MRSVAGICIILALAPALALARAHAPKTRRAPAASTPAPAPAAPQVCGEDCLDSDVDKVLQAMMDHDPSKAPLAPDVRYTENGEAKTPGQGFWATASAIAVEDDGLSTLGRSSSAYRLYFTDAASGQAAYFGAFTENGVPGMMMLRLKAAAGKITEIEAVLVRRKDPPPTPPEPGLDPHGFDEPEPTLLAGGERWPPEVMAAAAGRYLDGMATGSSAGVPLGSDCVRRDNGIQTTGRLDLPPPDPANPAYRPFALGCAAQLDSGFFSGVLGVRQRILVVNEDRGLVMALAMVDHGRKTPAPAPAKKKRAKRNAPPPPPAPTLSTDLMGVIFKMSNGRITRIEAIARPVAKDAPLGWTP